MVLFIISIFIAAAPTARAQTPALGELRALFPQETPPAPAEPGKKPAEPEWSFAKAKAAYEDGAATRKPAPKELLGEWAVEAELRDPAAKDRLPLFQKLAKLDSLLAKLAFVPHHDKKRFPDAIMLELELTALLQSVKGGKGKPVILPKTWIACAPAEGAFRGADKLEYRSQEPNPKTQIVEITTWIKVAWSLSCRALGEDRLLCLAEWNYKAYHHPMDKDKPLLNIEEQAFHYSIYRRTKK